MASVKGIRFGGPMIVGSSPAFGNHTLDANNDGVGWGFSCPTADAITHIGFRVGTGTVSPNSPPTYVATLEGWSTSTGAPNGTDIGGGSPTAATFTPPNDGSWDGTWQWVALTNSYTPTRGQIVCPTIRYSSGTIGGSNNISLTTQLSSLTNSSFTQFPNTFRLTAGSWARTIVWPIGALRTASSRFGYPAESLYNTRSASTVGHRQAMKFTLPSGSGDTFKVRGARFCGSIAGAGGKTPVFGLWDGSGVIQSVAIDSDVVFSASSSYLQHEFYFDESSLTALSFGTAYYLGLEVADAVNGGVLLNGLQLDSADDLSAWEGGSEFHFATYNGSAWSDDTTVRPFVEPIFDDLTEPSGSGGGVFVIGG